MFTNKVSSFCYTRNSSDLVHHSTAQDNTISSAAKMVPVDVFMLLLLGAAMVFSLVETGMLAYSIYMGDRVDGMAFGACQWSITHTNTFTEYNFLLLCSVWTLLVAPAIIISLITRRVGSSIGGPNKLPLFGPLILGLKAVTMVFWAGGAAALLRISIILNREIPMYYFEGFFAAKLAFPIITW